MGNIKIGIADFFAKMFFRKLRLTKSFLNSMTTRLKSTKIPEDIQTAKNLVQHIESINDSPNFFTLHEIKNNLITTLEDYEELNTLLDDPDLGQTAQEDILKLEKEVRQMIKFSSKLLLSSRKFDASDAILEVQAG